MRIGGGPLSVIASAIANAGTCMLSIVIAGGEPEQPPRAVTKKSTHKKASVMTRNVRAMANAFIGKPWLPDMDLNHDKQIQSLLCYRYTIGQTGVSQRLNTSLAESRN